MTIDVTATINLLHALNNSEYTALQLETLTGLKAQAVRRWLNKMRAKKLIYICDWTRNGTVYAPVYTWGFEMEDAKKRTFTKREIDARYHQRRQTAIIMGVARS